MIIRKHVVGPIDTNCYLVADEASRAALVLDPDLRTPQDVQLILGELRRADLRLECIVNTHGHTDHTAGNAGLKRATGAPILVHELDAPNLTEPWRPIMEHVKHGPCPACGAGRNELKVSDDRTSAVVSCPTCGLQLELVSSPPADRVLRDGDAIELGRLAFRVIHTPGHTPGGISLYVKEENAVFTGDTLFNLAIGRTDLPGGSAEEIQKSLAKLKALPPETAVYPGHGDATTIAQELRDNPYLKQPA